MQRRTARRLARYRQVRRTIVAFAAVALLATSGSSALAADDEGTDPPENCTTYGRLLRAGAGQLRRLGRLGARQDRYPSSLGSGFTCWWGGTTTGAPKGAKYEPNANKYCEGIENGQLKHYSCKAGTIFGWNCTEIPIVILPPPPPVTDR